MIKKSIAVLLVATISLLILVRPAYAESMYSPSAIGASSNQTSVFEQSTKFIGDTAQKFAREMGNQVVAATAYVTLCYAADALATSVFPPAGFIAPACPFIAEGFVTTEAAIAGVGGATLAKKAVQTVVH